jgi:hypothetical protein
MTNFDVIVFGPVFCDLTFTGLPGLPQLGKEHFADDLTVTLGGSGIVAAGLRRLGLKVGLIANLGSDRFSKILWSLLEEHDIDRSLIQRHPDPLNQVTVALSYPEDRAFVTLFEEPDTPVDLERIVSHASARHFHISSVLTSLAAPGAVQLFNKTGATVSADPGWDEDALRSPQVLSAYKSLDFFLPSESELRHMARENDLKQAMKKMDALLNARALIVKQSTQGVCAYLPKRGETLSLPALKLEAVDTTGAGDAFDAGFIYGCLQGAPLQDCMAYGVVCGGLTTTIRGGTKGFPTIEEMKKWREKLQS